MTSKLAPKRAAGGTDVSDGNVVVSETIPKARWDDIKTKSLLKICVEEVQAGNRPHTHFTKEGWKNIVAKFYLRTGVSYNYKQLKNKWDILKKEFSMWAKLVEHQTGLGWDPIKRTIVASDDWWERKKQENSEYLKWRNEGPKFLDMTEICFKDVVAIGYMALMPYADPSTDNEVSNDDVHNEMNERGTDADNFHVDGATPEQCNDITRAEISIAQDKKRRKTTRKERKSATDKLQESFDRLISGMDNMSRSTTSKAEDEDPYSIGKCVDLLDMMPGVERGSPEYYLMVRMFARKTYKETFVHLMNRDPSLAKGWLSTFNMDNIDRF
ncbi:L10-interacting MYB domain-containing protein-like [Dioscorea cayenensis subsp. rotundata]|uniref:L10-interacting MYB domain-containing protein-like n=1 Tax=Dioscorea cayennensis subsp. rotundata TaxID=55577 RepID=A0AB40B8L9_DIOCR|nr:L10-interacting MYB domain-containing protein-like [Dioscorea cayenensis subsp. rotundata]